MSETTLSGRQDTPSGWRRTLIASGVGLASLMIVGIVFIAWQIASVSHTAQGHSERSFVVDTDFCKIMVRKNATGAIVANSGMELIDERIQGLEVDTSNDARPILNALRGQSQSELAATKQIIVGLKDPALEANRLALTQQAMIDPKRMQVRTVANKPAGNLEGYETTLTAEPEAGKTRVRVTIDQTVRVNVPKLLISQADSRVQAAADEATRQQQQAISDFVAQYADQLVILPELGSK